jgi:hypothetical protein
MKDKSQRPDLLQVQTTSRTGRMSAIARKGVAYLTVSKGFNEPSSQIAIEVQHSTGVGSFKANHLRTSALICITFADAPTWSGTFEDLKQALKKP